MKTILMTGVTGYLGSKVVQTLSNYPNIKMVGLKRSKSPMGLLEGFIDRIDLVDVDVVNWEESLKQYKFDVVFHLATNYGRDDVLFKSVLDSNFYFPLQVLQYALEQKIPYFINTDTALNKLTNSYSLSKKQLLDWLYFHQNRIKVVNLVLESNYGQDDGQFIANMIHCFMDDVSSLDTTEGLQRRDFIYIDDVISAIETVINNLEKLTGTFNEFGVGSGKNYSIKEVLLKIQTMIGNTKTKIKFGALQYRPHEIMDSTAQISRLCALGWEPKMELNPGLAKTIELIRKSR